MKKNTLMAIPAILALTAAVLMSGCGSSGSTETQQTESVAEVSVSEEANNTSVITKSGSFALDSTGPVIYITDGGMQL